MIQCDRNGIMVIVLVSVNLRENSEKTQRTYYDVDFICPVCSNDICDNARESTLSPVTALPPYAELPPSVRKHCRRNCLSKSFHC